MGIVMEAPESFLMNKMDLAESALVELINDHQTQVQEDIRKQVSVVQTEILQEIETFCSAIARIEKYSESRKEVERKLDLQYRRKVDEALKSQSEVGQSIESAESALTLENQRLKKLEEIEAINKLLKSRSNKDFSSFEKLIARAVKQIRGTKVNVIAKSNEIIKILKDPRCPVSIGISTFAKKIVSAWQNPFACSYVIVYVTSEFPQAMDIILAEFHKACIYTVPKHIAKSEDEEACYRRIKSVMRLYGALVQTDIGGGITNIHGIEHGWAWLAKFLNNKMSANNNNIATATALCAFLETAGFGLHQMYKSHFLKLVNVVREHFLGKLREEKDSSGLLIITIMAYLDDQMYLKEPKGRTLVMNLLSTKFIAELQYQSLLSTEFIFDGVY